MAAVLGQIIADMGQNASDSQSIATLEQNLIAALRRSSLLLPYDSSFANKVGGYPSKTIVADPTTTGAFWVSTADNNLTTPGASGASWQSLFMGLVSGTLGMGGATDKTGLGIHYNGYTTKAYFNYDGGGGDLAWLSDLNNYLNKTTATTQTVTGPVTFSIGPTVPTAAFGTSTTQAASTEFATKMKPGRLLGVFSVGGSATYFPPRQDATLLFRVRASAAGGGGAPVPSYGTYVMGAAGGGASGSYAEMWFTWAQLMNTTSTGGAAIAVIVGKGGTSGNAGGATTVGNALVCPGGSQGGSANGGGYSSLSAGGSSGGPCTMPNGTWSYGINFPGQGGGPGIVQNPQQGGTCFGISGSGGSNPFGSGAGGVGSSNTQGANGLVGWVGGGGSGACSGRVTSGTTTAQTGGTGGDGWVIIECYEAISA
ncbi:hypothetical protein [Asaia bogorensis]|uniref:hypothetical protein n=1 Tax=Asaia bogorensis TaxID=91915 RepID=UPI00286D69C0|nr:hypothetical protein [Asaia bogorensis]